MVNYYNPRRADHDEEYERWRHHGHERGFFERAKDRIASWFDGNDKHEERSYRGTYGKELYGRAQEYDRLPSGGMYEHHREQNRPYGQQYGEQSFGHQGPIDRWTLGDTEFGDYGTRPSHRGRGPRNYQRNDERIREELIERLTRHHDIDASDVEIEVQAGEITLKGMVESRWEKRLAEDVCEDTFGVKHVSNKLKVRQMMNLPPQEQQQRGQQQQTRNKDGVAGQNPTVM